ncbi:MAG: ABC transporter ATP-binding protein [Oscillospiraceae bacterium]|nr:ABC transporter ATP-binding protein [Oscillospiraceae bacterium]
MIFTGLHKTYNGRRVLDVDSLELQKGRIYAVVGANGSGKSTLARLCAGVIKADGGYVKSDVHIGYLPQKSYAFRMSTRRNLRINGSDREREEHLLRELKINGLASARANKLSGGETARMALARLLMREYELLILDEPGSAMDIEATLLSEKLITDYRDRTGCAVLIVTHSLAQAQRMSDEVIFLSGGVIAEQGSPEAIIGSPQNEKTREFIEFYSK